MTNLARNILLVVGFVLIAGPSAIIPQSQAQGGQIEGTVRDQNQALVVMALVTVSNNETGATRSAVTDESGLYRFPLLPLGTYRIVVESENFKKLIREGIVLTTGQTATIDLALQLGEVREVVSVSADSSVADSGKTELSRVMNTREVQNIPLISRNPYNFALLQANVTGRPSRGFAFPNFNVNGYLRRVNYLIDGNANTAYDRRSRFLIISETSVSEVQLVTNGFAAEFGDTPGMIMNIVTPSGTNGVHGEFSYRFRRPSFYSRPFTFSAADFPDNRADILTTTFGGPIVRDRWHYYFGFEWQNREDNATAARILTITPDNRNRLIAAGLSPSIFPTAIPGSDHGSNYIFKTDLQINRRNRLSTRINHANVDSQNPIGGRLNTLERGYDFASIDTSLGVQLASYTQNKFNELRLGFGQRNWGFNRNSDSATGPTISINGIANLGPAFGLDNINPPQKISQLQDNVTWKLGSHNIKVGGGFSHHDFTERAPIYRHYVFSSINNYIAARSGTNPRAYNRYEESFGDPNINYKATYSNFFIQDDWKVTRRLKVNYGLRYDLYQIPKADPSSPFPLSRKFDVDRDDFSPRLGLVYSLRDGNRPTVLRIGAGIYYEAPLFAVFRDVIRYNGNPRLYNVTFSSSNGPLFPNAIGSLPAGTPLPQQDIYTIASDYDTMYAIHSNIQLEQALSDDLSLAVGYVHSAGRHLNVYRNINVINPVRYLSDGRPVFGDDRLDPRFGWIVIAESGGVASYDAFSLQLKQRLSRGLQFSINYTLSKGINDAPDGDFEATFLSDPTNRSHDLGHSSADQRHTFVTTMVYAPKFGFTSKALRWIFNSNQVGVTANAYSGMRFNITSADDINHDDIFGDDRPVGFQRNSGKTPSVFNLDLRYSRFVDLGDRFRLEFFAEFQNLLNINSIIAYSNVLVDTDADTGALIGPLPDFRARNQSVFQESRQVQLGIKLIF